jgi:soluble lytic murein transglycosylase-like protein
MIRPAITAFKKSHKMYFTIMMSLSLFLIILPILLAPSIKLFEKPTLLLLASVIAQQNHLSPRLIHSMISRESSWRTDIVSHEGAIGLMQVMPEWLPKLKHLGIRSRKDLLIPEKNLQAGCFILKTHLKEERGDLSKALIAYSGHARDYDKKVFNLMKGETYARNRFR